MPSSLPLRSLRLLRFRRTEPAPNAKSASEEDEDAFVKLKKPNPFGFLPFLRLADGELKKDAKPRDAELVAERST
jgi:hypothetical protein